MNALAAVVSRRIFLQASLSASGALVLVLGGVGGGDRENVVGDGGL